MRMDEIGYHHRHDKDFVVDRPMGAGDWLLLIIKTPGIFLLDGVETTASPNSYILYTPEYPQHYRTDPNAGEYIDDWMHFGPDPQEEALIREYQIPLNKPVHLRDITGLSVLLRTMCHEFYSAHTHRVDTVNSYFHILLNKIHEQLESVSPVSVFAESSYGERLMWIRECIFRRQGYTWNIDELAADLSLSRSRFQHLYSETFGTSVTQDIIASRIQFATELLKNPEIPVEKIAEMCGYTSASYFIRQFKEQTGCTPSQFRKNI